ncbi:MAG: Ku protein [Acidimicrobiia bacterium]|nr:Ku protein [Acidimicrobiia bacterium]
MARAIWSGAISFGLVSIPVKLYNAVSRKSVSFNQIDGRTGSRVRQKLVSAADGDEVPRDEIVKGYNLGGDQYVIISEDELASVMPVAQRSIDLEEFVDLAEIDPVFYDSAYHLVPEKAAIKPYKLLSEAMEEAGKVGVARFVMRSKSYVAAIRPAGGHLMLSTMVYADELNDVDELPELEDLAKVEVSDRERAMATQLIENLAAEFDPTKYHDTYRVQLLEMIDRKAAGETQLAPAAAVADDSRVVDLLAALEASVAEAKAARDRHPTALSPAEAEEAKPKAKPRARARKSA